MLWAAGLPIVLQDTFCTCNPGKLIMTLPVVLCMIPGEQIIRCKYCGVLVFLLYTQNTCHTCHPGKLIIVGEQVDGERP